MAILKNEIEENFTKIPNFIFRDDRLSFKSIGIYCKLRQLPNGWEFTVEGMKTQVRDGRDSIINGIKELEEFGYLKKYRERKKDGTLGDVILEVVTSKPTTEKPTLEKPTLEKPQQSKTDLKKDLNERKNDLNCCSLEEVPTNAVVDFGDEELPPTNNEQTIISDLQALNIPTTNFVVETVRDWIEEHDVKLLQAVIDKCVSTATNGVNLNYLKKAVDRLTTQNIKSLEDLERAEELRAKQRGSKYGKQQRVEVMPTYEAPTEVEQTLESEHELAMIKFMMGQGPHPETGEMNPSPLS